MKNLCFIFLLLVSIAAKAQVNLVPNPSFEDYNSCPSNPGQVEAATYWISPTGSSSDYFNVCATDNDVKVPLNIFGMQSPFEGNAYVGLCPYWITIPNYREYILTNLTSELEAGKLYCVSFYVSLAGKVVNSFTNGVQLYLSANQPITNSGDPLQNYTPQIEASVIINDTINWIQVSSIYQAIGGERYLTIGNFKIDDETILVPFNLDDKYIYMYIDNVSVIDCSDNIPIISPNVFTPNNDDFNDVFEIKYLQPNSQLTIYNRWGSVVYSSTNYQNNWNGENLNDGVYYYMLTVPSGNTTKGTVTILRN